jgi:hypothetical protein
MPPAPGKTPESCVPPPLTVSVVALQVSLSTRFAGEPVVIIPRDHQYSSREVHSVDLRTTQKAMERHSRKNPFVVGITRSAVTAVPGHQKGRDLSLAPFTP